MKEEKTTKSKRQAAVHYFFLTLKIILISFSRVNCITLHYTLPKNNKNRLNFYRSIFFDQWF